MREFVELAFAHVGLDWEEHVVKTDPAFIRPAEVDLLVGDSGQGREQARLDARRSTSRGWSR